MKQVATIEDRDQDIIEMMRIVQNKQIVLRRLGQEGES